jgi:RNA polymerase sigma factor (sigma-70 family)
MNGRVSDTLRRLQAVDSHDAARDGDLLVDFVRHRDPAAFEQLVRRHGPMVLGVCRRVLGDAHDADDAFQATFLVLARRAAAVAPRDAVGNWLYGVAYRTALEARRMAARRRAREVHLAELPQPAVESETASPELSAVLDHELSRLPDRLRLPVVLCDLEGRTRREVARQLGIPDGTLSNRLAAARRLLAKRLASRGVTLSAGGLALLLARDGSATVPAGLVRSTIEAAIAASSTVVPAAVSALTYEVIKAMYLAKLKTVSAVLLVVGALLGAGVFGGRGMTAEPQAPKTPTPAPPTKADPPKKADAAIEIADVLGRAADEVKSLPASSDDALAAKVKRLVGIAHYQSRYGNKDRAARMFLDALEVATQIKAEEKRAESLANAGFYQANAGFTDDARKTVDKITLKSEAETHEHRAGVQAEIASALAKAGKVNDAVKVAEAIPDRVIKYKSKDKDTGKEKVVERRDSMRRDWAFQHILEAQLKSDDPAGAAMTVRRVTDESRRITMTQEVIKGLAKAGDKAAATRLLNDLKAEMEKSEVYRKPVERNRVVVMLQAAIGDGAAALAFIEKVESAEDRAELLDSMSVGLAYRKVWNLKGN